MDHTKSKVKSKGGSFSPDTRSNGMAGFSGAAPAAAGQISTGGRSGNTKFAPDTNKNGMAGFTGATPAKSC